MKKFLKFITKRRFFKSKLDSKLTSKPQAAGVTFTILSKQEVETDRSSAYAYLL